jgi:hypothetical protein
LPTAYLSGSGRSRPRWVRTLPDTELPPRVYVRCTDHPHQGFDRFAEAAKSSSGWTHREIASAHLPYITDPDELTALLVEIAE